MTTSQEEPVTLHTIAGGAAAELFDRELERIVADILDLNTEACAIREIDIKVKIKPDENRNFGAVAITVTSKTGAPKGVGTMLFFGKRNGMPVAVENNPQQPKLFDQLGPRPVVDFETGEVKDVPKR